MKKIAVSNIGWDIHDDPEIFKLLRDNGVNGIEIAPTKIWPDWNGATEKSAKAYRSRLREAGFEVPALQAIVYGKPLLQLFDLTVQVDFLEHIKLVSSISAALGAKVLVFGAPKNRKRGQLSMDEAMKRAIDIMHLAGEICMDRGVCIGWEHNPVAYECDFITNVADGRQLIDMIDSEGVKLHLDSGGIHMCGGDIGDVIRSAGEFVHYHASEPMLNWLDYPCVDHKKAGNALQDIEYSEWISIEMRSCEGKLNRLVSSIKHIRETYGR